MIAGGSGITPFLQILSNINQDKISDSTEFTLLYANKTSNDILLKDRLDQFKGQGIKVEYVLDNASQDWSGHVGGLSADLIEDVIPIPSRDHLVFYCGSLGMNDHVKQVLEDLGH
jgi:cytochrome-b5 reductase